MAAVEVGAFPPAIEFTKLHDEKKITLDELRQGKVTIIDFWTTRCEKCPQALDKLNAMAGIHVENDNVVFASCVLDDLNFGQELVEEGGWDHMTHLFVDVETKEMLKEKLGFKMVPFYLILDKEGCIAQKGGPKNVDFEKLPELLAAADVNGSTSTINKPLVIKDDF